MPLSEADFVQSASGGFNTSSGSVTLPGGTTAGNTVIIRCFTYGGQTVSIPSGFTRDSPALATSQKGYIFRKSNVGGGETSYTLTMSAAGAMAWWVDEIQGLDVDQSPVDATSPWTTATAATASTGTTGQTTTYDGVALGFHGARDAASGTPPTWSGQTNTFEEQGEQGQAVAAGTSSVGMAVLRKFLTSLGTQESTGTHSLSPSTAPVGGTMVVYAAAGAKRDAAIAVMAGFEWGTTAGITTGNTGSYIFGGSAGSPAITTSTPRTGSYCLELSASAAAEWLGWDTSHFGTAKTTMVVRLCVYFPTALPAGDVALVELTGGAGLALRFRQASSKLAVQVGAGTEQLAATTVAADTWYGVDLRYSTVTTTHTGDWQLDGVDQTQATGSGTAGAQISAVSVGWSTAATATVRYDDIACSVVPGNYPLGDLRLYPLTVDTGASLTLSGTAANWKTYTANGTLAAWDATVARDAVDEVPPTIGASADGLAQVTAASAEYVEVPLTTRQAVPAEAIRSVRVYVCGWSPSATAQSFRVDGYDGAVATTLHAVADPNFDNSTTAPAWVAKMWKPATGWTQAKLDAAAVRLGFSAVAQDVGVHGVLAEVATQPVAASTLFGTLASQQLDPNSAGVLGVTVDTTTTGQPADLYYEESGSPTTVPVSASTTHTEVIEAPDAPTVNRVELQPAAEWPGPEPPPEPM